MKYYLCLLILLFPLSSFSMLILKTKDRKAFIHLQGVNTQAGSYFRIYDLEGNKKGLLQIDKVSHTKAIGTLKAGSMAKKWNLLFVSKKMAMAEIQKVSEKRRQLALIRKEKLKRKLALQQKRKRQRQLAQLKRLRQQKRLQRQKATERRLASFQLEEDILEDLKEVNDSSDFGDFSQQNFYQAPEDKQSQAILSYEDEEPEEISSSSSSAEPEPKKSSKSFSPNFIIGLSPAVQYSQMSMKPENRPPYTMRGLGGEIGLQAFLPLNPFIDIGGFLGYRYFSNSAGPKACAKDVGCHLKIHYISGALNFKLKYLDIKKHQLWLKLQGHLLMPLAYSNKGILKKENFGLLHGTIGGGLGIDLNFGKWLVPIGFEAGVYMPPTATVFALTGGLRTGVLYKF